MSRRDWLEATFRRMSKMLEGRALSAEEAELPFHSSDAPLHRPMYYFVPGLADKPWHDPEEFPWTRDFVASWSEIDDEIARLLSSHPAFRRYDDGGGASLVDAGDWSMFDLASPWTLAPIDEHCARLPTLWRLIASAPRVSLGFTGLSAMAPGTHVLAHCGHTNAKVRFHFGLRVPEGCGMRVGREERPWKEREFLAFEDSFEHEVWNRGSGTRLVALFDVFHPDLSDDEVATIRAGEARLAEARRAVFGVTGR